MCSRCATSCTTGRNRTCAPGRHCASRAIGTGCMLDSTRFRDRLAHHLKVAPGAVHAYVYGEHGDSQVLHWSSAVAGGVPILSFAEQLGRPIDAALQHTMAEDVRDAAYRIKAGKGVSNFGIGGCIARLVHALVADEQGVFPVSTGFVVSALARPEWLVEIDATAVIPD